MNPEVVLHRLHAQTIRKYPPVVVATVSKSKTIRNRNKSKILTKL